MAVADRTAMAGPAAVAAGCLIRRSAAGLCAALLIAGWGGPLSAQTSIVPEGQDPAGPQSIEDLLDGIAEEDAPPDWAEPGQPQRPTPDQDRAFAILRALDKMTARIETLSVPVGGEMAFGTLTVTVRACRSAAENAEHAAFLEIVDAPPWDDPGRAFAGWMFAEARTLNVMEHAVYDVWLERCAAEPERPPEDFGATVRFTLPDDPPPPLPVPTFRR
jgi:hypothetical protein